MSLKLFRKQAYVGVDLGTNTIKVAQIDAHGRHWSLSRHGEFETPEDSIKDGVVVDPGAVADALRMALKSARISATSAIIGVAGGSVIVRNVRIPRMPEATLRKSIRFEAGRYVPSSIEDSFIEFEILGDAPDNQMDVLIVAAPREIVKSRLDACSKAGLEVEIVDIEAFAMYRALVESDTESELAESTVALVDIGATTTNVSVISKGVFAMTRSIPQAGNTLTSALQSYFKLDFADAEKGKSQLDLTQLVDAKGPVENPPLRVIQPHIDDLFREIRRSLNYYQSQQTDQGEAKPVTKIIVSGGAARMPGLAEYMTYKLDIETVAAGVYDCSRFIGAEGDAESHGFELAVASGLALRAHSKAA
ncbi:MAG TPA: type IV pilus assembly protein PilM [Fimbriimonadaceae bacterium]|nr:type IV pilus assembly protein PilM [Fimbriimonadaceae bacterium]